MPCKYGCNKCSECKLANTQHYHDMFRSPVRHASKLGKYVPIVSKNSIYNKMAYSTHQFDNDLKDKKSIIYMLDNRLAKLSPSDSRYSLIYRQKEQLEEDLDNLRKERNSQQQKNNQLLQLIDNHPHDSIPSEMVSDILGGKASYQVFHVKMLNGIKSEESELSQDNNGDSGDGDEIPDNFQGSSSLPIDETLNSDTLADTSSDTIPTTVDASTGTTTVHDILETPPENPEIQFGKKPPPIMQNSGTNTPKPLEKIPPTPLSMSKLPTHEHMGTDTHDIPDISEHRINYDNVGMSWADLRDSTLRDDNDTQHGEGLDVPQGRFKLEDMKNFCRIKNIPSLGTVTQLREFIYNNYNKDFQQYLRMLPVSHIQEQSSGAGSSRRHARGDHPGLPLSG